MSYELLGESFDIHGGGNDLMFPHHENEIAQSCCAHPGGGFASVWMHNEMLQVEGRKMSKSLGNFFTVRDLLDRGVPGEVIRFVFLSTHYRKPMDWTERKRSEAAMHLKAWFRSTENVEPDQNVAEVCEVLANDLNTPAAISLMHMFQRNGDYAKLRAAMALLGFPSAELVDWFRGGTKMAAFSDLPDMGKGVLWTAVTRWQELRDQKRYAEADELKARIEDVGVKLSVSVAGPEVERLETYDPSKLEALK